MDDGAGEVGTELELNRTGSHLKILSQHLGQELVVKDVAERGVAQVVAQSRQGNPLHVLVVDPKVPLRPLDPYHHLLRHVAHSQRVLKPVVPRPREHIVARSQLLDVSQALEFWRVDDPHALAPDPKVAMNRVVYDLGLALVVHGYCGVVQGVHGLRGAGQEKTQ